MAEIQGDVAANAGIRFVGQKFGSVEDTAVARRPYLAPLLEVARANPRNPE